MKYLKIYIGIICFLVAIAISNVHYSAYKKEGIENFPDSYKPYLQELQKKHPNWKFTALYTELDWNYVINNENVFGKNLVPKSYSDRWKNTKTGEYNVEVDAGWVDCSRRAVEYAMDPRNFLNNVRIFQFEELSYDEKTNNIEGIEKILYGTEFYNKIVQYVNSSGNTITMSQKYSDLILDAAKTSRVSSYHLASRIKQEVGPFLSHSSISGTVAGYEGLYNFYNIGATSSSEPMGAIKNGLKYARDGKGASQTTKDKYLIPWNTKARAITGGGIFIGSSYIHLGQDTVYLQKFHVVSNNSGELFWHQYMTNVLAPYSESKSIYNGYVNTGILNNSMSFVIPVYNNMPEYPVESPNILESDFVSDNTKVYADVSNTLNIRSGPSTSYEVLTSVDRNVTMTRIARGVQSGELWDKIQLPNGMVGYVFHNYLEEIKEIQIEKINLSIDRFVINKGESVKLNVEILPEEAKEHEIELLSSDTSVATIDSDGNILGIKSGRTTITVKAKENNVSSSLSLRVHTPVEDMELDKESLTLQIGDSYILNPIIYPEDADNKKVIYNAEIEGIVDIDSAGIVKAIGQGSTKIIVKTQEKDIQREVVVTVLPKLADLDVSFDENLKVEDDEISGFNVDNLQVANIKEMISSNYNIEFYNYNGEKLSDDALVGTGSKIRLVDENGVIKMEYQIIIYGDTNGDGRINSIDVLILQKHIVHLEKLHGVFLKAGDIRRTGQNPTTLDALLIQRHIVRIEYIKQ